LLTIFALPAAWGQTQQQPQPPQPPRPTFQPPLGGDYDTRQGGSVQDERLLRVLNAERQKSMVQDANKLLRMARELNAEIVRTSPDALTPDQLRKMAEIEKLARNVKDKMGTSVRVTPGMLAPIPPEQ